MNMNNSSLFAEVPDNDPVSAAADRACLYVALSAASLIGSVLLTVAPRSILSPVMMVSAVITILTFPVSAYLATRHILRYVRLLHERQQDVEHTE
ncbi:MULTISPECIES: hypothetical protein [Enterobacteriaceae]|uniref:hypothetical protein n=1 Tax=Enterobacteriaceae TaxID=543 RepID=UPI002FF5A8B4|nr:hypothetical protein [Enterobacter hormaechei subsp. steigerwaltii]